MLSKCANPACSEIFRYLHQGKIFLLAPTPAMQALAEERGLVVERFWLCNNCAKEFTVIWDGARAKMVRLEEKQAGAKIPQPATREDIPVPEMKTGEAVHPAHLHSGPRAAFAARRLR